MSTRREADQRSSEEIRRDIERTRSRMDATSERLEQRLSPGQLLDQAWGAMKGSSRGGGGGGINAGAVGDVVRDHPVPLALMGLGLAWLGVEAATGGSGVPNGPGRGGPGTYEPAPGRVGPYRGDAVSGDRSGGAAGAKEKAMDAARKAGSRVSGAAEQAGERLSRAKDEAADRLSGASDAVREKAGSAAGAARERAPDGGDWDEAQDRVRHAASRMGDEARHGARRAQRGFSSLMESQPLALGAVALGFGLAAGLAAPRTRWEDEHVGEQADQVKGEAKETARETGQAAREVASDAAEAAREEAEEQDIASELKESATQVAESAKEAARERAENEGMTGEGLKERADRVRKPGQE